MMSVIPSIFAMLLFIGGGASGNSDFLDLLSTDAYWQAKDVVVSTEQLQRDAVPPAAAPANIDQLVKDLSSDNFKTRNDAKAKLEAMGPAIAPLLKPVAESKDPEVASAATDLIKRFSASAQARNIRRLMAIRTLGERKTKEALPLLTELTASKDLFVAEYAARSIAQIQGKPLPKADHRKAIAADLKLLPKETGIVMQSTGIGGITLNLEKVIDQSIEAQKAAMAAAGPGGAPLNIPDPDKKKIMARATKEMLKALEAVGNVRIDGITLGVDKDAGPEGVWVIMSIRGKYDPAAVLDLVKSQEQGEFNRMKIAKEGNVDVIQMGREATMLLPSSDQLIMIVGQLTEEKSAALTKDVLAAMSAPKGKLAENEELASAMKTVDMTSPLWGAALLNKEMQKEKSMEAFDTVTLAAKQDVAAADKPIQFTFTAKGSDAEKVKASADAMTANIQEAINQMKPMVAMMKPMQSVVDVLESIKVNADGKSATMTGQIKPASLEAGIAGGAGFWLMSFGHDEIQPDQGEAPAPAVEVEPMK